MTVSCFTFGKYWFSSFTDSLKHTTNWWQYKSSWHQSASDDSALNHPLCKNKCAQLQFLKTTRQNVNLHQKMVEQVFEITAYSSASVELDQWSILNSSKTIHAKPIHLPKQREWFYFYMRWMKLNFKRPTFKQKKRGNLQSCKTCPFIHENICHKHVRLFQHTFETHP